VARADEESIKIHGLKTAYWLELLVDGKIVAPESSQLSGRNAGRFFLPSMESAGNRGWISEFFQSRPTVLSDEQITNICSRLDQTARS
jgi:hypothetical protein